MMKMPHLYPPMPARFRILVEVDRELLERIDALAAELEESRQPLLGRIIGAGLTRERRRLNRQRRALLAQQTALLGSEPRASANPQHGG